MHMPVMPVHQPNQPTLMGYYTPYPVPQLPLRTQAGASTDQDEHQRSPTLGLGAEDTRGFAKHSPTQPPTNLRLFGNDVFNTQNPETAQNRINRAVDRLEDLINNAAIDNVSQSAKDGTQALANRLNGNDI